jgi:hypothetical protein
MQGYPDNFLSLNNIVQANVRTNHIPGDLPSAYTQSWHFSIQRELAQDWVLDVGYVGTRGVNLMILGDLNQARPNGPTENLSINARRPIQGFGFIQTAFGAGFLNYHALQAKVEKRFGQGLYLLNSFTWSKAIDNASGHLETANGDSSRVNYHALPNECGLSGYDQPFNNTTTVLWEFPFGNAGRNIVRGPRVDVMNLGLHKEFAITERFRLEFRTEAFNALNRTNFDNPNGNRSSGAFGAITSTNQNPARQVQFALRLAF